MRTDPIADLRSAVRAYLERESDPASIAEDRSLSTSIPWRPNLLQADTQTAWYLMAHVPEGSGWQRRLAKAREQMPKLNLAIGAPWQVLLDPDTLDAADELDVRVLPVEDLGDSYKPSRVYNSVGDLIYERDLRLDPVLARTILERGILRAVREPNDQRKGVLLEVVAAVMFSQVDGWRVSPGDISRRSQQMDVAIENGRVGGILGRGQMVLAEVKNWTKKVGTTEYHSLRHKMTSSNGFVKMGFLLSTDLYTEGVYIEALRDTTTDLLIVLLDQHSFPAVWRNYSTVNEGIERTVMQALEDQRQRNARGPED